MDRKIGRQIRDKASNKMSIVVSKWWVYTPNSFIILESLLWWFSSGFACPAAFLCPQMLVVLQLLPSPGWNILNSSGKVQMVCHTAIPSHCDEVAIIRNKQTLYIETIGNTIFKLLWRGGKKQSRLLSQIPSVSMKFLCID